MSVGRRNKRFQDRLKKSVMSKDKIRKELEFVASLEHENRMLQALVVQKKLVAKVKGNIFIRYFNYWFGINPMLQIMVSREKLLHGLGYNEALEDKGGSGSSKTDSS